MTAGAHSGSACDYTTKRRYASTQLQPQTSHPNPGVIPGRGPSPSPSSRRCTLMVAFWRELQVREPHDEQLGASMPMPSVPAGSAAAAAELGAPSWLEALAPLRSTGGCSAEVDAPHAAPRIVSPAAVPAIWEPVATAMSQQAPSYDACFQGF